MSQRAHAFRLAVVAGSFAMPRHVSGMTICLFVDVGHRDDTSDGEADDERGDAPATIRVGRYKTIDVWADGHEREINRFGRGDKRADHRRRDSVRIAGSPQPFCRELLS